MKKIISITVLILVFSFWGISNAEKNEMNIGAWIAYWDVNEGINEWKMARYGYDNISFFGAYFDDTNHLFVPKGFMEMIKQQPTRQRYFTVVNDVDSKDKKVFKDVEIIKAVLSSPKKREEHAEEIIALTKKAKCKGIDLDYERVFRDEKVADLYLKFIKVLYEKAKAENLHLRVILEPNVNFQIYEFPQGPMYIVMLYNLYGTHSKDDGPKADFNFIEKTINKMQYLPDERGVAFSTGGCIWDDEGKSKFISSTEAILLSEKYKIKPERKVDSGALFFKYNDEKKVEYKVWYADKKTISEWIDKANSLGIKNIVLWHLGQNEIVYDF